jgi:hypothetical protein
MILRGPRTVNPDTSKIKSKGREKYTKLSSTFHLERDFGTENSKEGISSEIRDHEI